MADLWTSLAAWWLHSAAVGGTILLLGYVLMQRTRQPARRQRAGAWAVRAALLGAALCAAPAWLVLPWQLPELGARNSERGTPERRARSAGLGTSNAFSVPHSVLRVPSSEIPRSEFRAPSSVLDPGGDAGPSVVWLASVPAAVPAEEGWPEPAPARGPGADGAGAVPPPGGAGAGESWAARLVKGGLLLYALGVLAGAGCLLVAPLALWRLQRRSAPAPRRVRELFADAAAAQGLRRVPRLRVSDRLAAPICCGLLRPAVLIPEALAASGDERALRWVFAHELSHLRRGDLWVKWWAAWAQALYFFLPWVWWLRRELRLSQEFLADAAAVDGASRPDEYAEFLVRLSCRLTGRRVAPLGAAGVRAGSSDLYRRVSMLLNDSEKIETRCPRRWSLLSAGGLLSLAVLLGGAGLRAGADEPAAEEKKAEKRIQVIVTPAEGEKVEKKIRVLIAEPGEGKQPGAVRVAPAKRRVAAVAGKPVRVFAVAQEDKPGAGAALEEIEKQLEQAGVPEEQKKSVLEALKKALEAAPKLKDGALQFRALPLGNVPRLGNPEMMRQIEEMRQQLQKMQEELEKEFGGFPRVFEVPAVPGVGFPKLEGVFEQPFRGAGQAFLATDQGGARLGVAINKPSEVLAEQLDLPEGQGIVIVDVQPDSAAAKAGLKANDILLELAGEKVPSDPAKFIEQVKGIEAGKEFSAVVLRKGRKETVKGLKLPEPKPAKGVFRARPEGQVRPFRFDVKPVVPAGGEASRESMSVQVRDGAFTADYSRDGVKIRLTGKAEGGEKKVESIRITDGDTDIKAKAPGEVPEKYRDAIERVLESISAE